VHWEWFYSWPSAFKKFFPKYSKSNKVNALFAVNVPFNFPSTTWSDGAFSTDVQRAMDEKHDFRVVDDKTVVFRPREWRGVDWHHNNIPFSKHNYLSVEDQ